jgi:hypothetical protein
MNRRLEAEEAARANEPATVSTVVDELGMLASQITTAGDAADSQGQDALGATLVKLAREAEDLADTLHQIVIRERAEAQQ